MSYSKIHYKRTYGKCNIHSTNLFIEVDDTIDKEIDEYFNKLRKKVKVKKYKLVKIKDDKELCNDYL